MNYKKYIAVLVLLFVCFSVFSASYVISGYKFDIRGNTKESTIRSLIVPAVTEKFSTEEELKAALEEKRQILINTRIFLEDQIFYQYSIQPSGGGNNNVGVIFVVADSKSTLFFPYPKYDSNTGLTLGLRYKNKNFLGRNKDFAIIVDTEQQEGSYKNGDFKVEIPFEEIKIKDIAFSGSLGGELDLLNKINNTVSLDMKETGLKIGNIKINSNVLLDFNYFNGNFNKLGYGVAVDNIKLGNNGTKLVARANMLKSRKTISDSYFDSTLNISHVRLGKTDWTNSTYVKYTPKDDKDLDKGLKFYKINDNLRMSFTSEKLERFSAGTDATFFKKYNQDGNYVETFSDLSYRYNDKITFALLFDTKLSEHLGLTNLIPGGRITVLSKLFKKIPYTFTFSEHNNIRLKQEDFQVYFKTTFGSSYGKINYAGNFRKGMQFNIYGLTEFHPWESKDKTTVYKFNVDFTAFPMALSWFNPSVRITLLSSSKSTYWEDDSGWRLDKDDVQQLFRGIKTNNKYVNSAYESSQLVGAFNLNLVTKMFVFEDFCKTYLNLFVDNGVIRAKNIDSEKKRDYKILTGVGFEVVAIMDSHPAYPIRASLGFNAENFYKRVIKDNKDVDLEYEVYVGLGWLF